MAETIFGETLTLSTGRVIPTRWIGEQHVREDLGRIPSFADWVRTITFQTPDWKMLRVDDLSLRLRRNRLPREQRLWRFTLGTCLK
jgi:hypothetical protein